MDIAAIPPSTIVLVYRNWVSNFVYQYRLDIEEVAFPTAIGRRACQYLLGLYNTIAANRVTVAINASVRLCHRADSLVMGPPVKLSGDNAKRDPTIRKPINAASANILMAIHIKGLGLTSYPSNNIFGYYYA